MLFSGTYGQDRFNTKLKEWVASLLPSAHLYRMHASIKKLVSERGMLNKHCLAIASPRLAPQDSGIQYIMGLGPTVWHLLPKGWALSKCKVFIWLNWLAIKNKCWTGQIDQQEEVFHTLIIVCCVIRKMKRSSTYLLVRSNGKVPRQ